MANFNLSITTEDSGELLEIVTKIAATLPLPVQHCDAFGKKSGPAQEVVEEEVSEPASSESGVVSIPERDGHGIRRDLRIHADAKDPIRASDNLWKRRKNVPDEQYEEIHLELVREARAAGLYTGPVVPELELESRVGPFYWEFQEADEFGKVDTLDELEALFERDRNCVEINEERYLKLLAEDSAATVAEAERAPAPDATAVPAPVEVAPPAPAPAPVPAAPAPGMSAEATPTYQQAVVALFNAGGPTAPQVALQAMGLTIATQATPQQLRDMVTAAEMVAELKIDKLTQGPDSTREALAALGYVAS